MNYLDIIGGAGSPFAGTTGALMLVVIVVWSLVWKGFALWRAGREGSKGWFIIMLIVNTLGILEILYLFFFSKKAGDARRARKAAGDGTPHQ